jgi:YVTN family beta-propeller protein
MSEDGAVPDLPSGTVTFLFTDIEGSTRLLRQLRDEYAGVLADHNRLLRESFARYGGTEVDTQGDAFFVVFPRARDAIGAAVEAQRVLAAHAWPGSAAVRVRMGIHSGEAIVEDGRYVGFGVHRAARICAAAHGGQILLSTATRELAEDDLPVDVSLRDLGEHRLKDIERPERLFQLTADDLQGDFAPPRAVPAAPARSRLRRRPLLAGGAVLVAAGAIAGVLAIFLGGTEKAKALPAVDANAVGIVDAKTGDVRKEVDVGTTPTDVAIGEGAAWITNSDDGTLSRVNLDTHAVEQTIRVGSGPAGVAVGAGAVWVANALDGTVSRVDSKTNQVVQTIRVGNNPRGIAAARSFVLVANANDGSLSRIDASSGRVVGTNRVGGGANAVALGFGSAWVTQGATARVSRFDERTGQQTATVNVGSDPTAVAVGGGAVWVANTGDGTVSRIDPETNAVAATFAVGRGPTGLAVADGAVWASDELRGVLVKVDASTNRVVETTPLGNRPEGVAVASGDVYVSVRATGVAHRGGTLRVIGASLGFDFVDPARAYSSGSWALLSMTNDGLTGFKRVGGGEGGDLVADLAVALPQPTDGGKAYTFKVRRGIRYSTGALVRPEDFRRAIERSVSLGGDRPGAGYFSAVVGAAACSAKLCDLSRGVVADDSAWTVTFRLTRSDPELPYKLALPQAYAVPASTPLPGKVDRPLPSTGPYEAARYMRNRGVTLEQNAHFRRWGSAARLPGIPSRVLWNFMGSPSAQIAAVEGGKADVTTTRLTAKQRTVIETRFASQLHVAPSPTTTYVFLNTRVAPFDDVRVRRALNFAIDRTAIVSASGGPEQAQPSCQVLPPGLPGYVPYCPYTLRPGSGAWSAPDLARAQQLVRASHTSGRRVTVWWPTFLARPAGDQVVRTLVALGYRARLKLVADSQKYFSALGDPKRRIQAGGDGWLADYTSSYAFFAPLLTCASSRATDSTNNAFFCDVRIDRHIARAHELQTTDPAAANVDWAKVDREVVDQAPWLFLDNPRSSALVSARVGNFQWNPQWGVLLDQLWVR